MVNFKLRAVAVAVAAVCIGGVASARQAAGTAPAAAPVAAAPATSPAPKTAATAAAAPKAARAATVDKPLWKELSRPQQVALDPLQGEWDKMDGLRKQKWLEIANRYSSMKPDEQLRVQERMRAWIKMTPEERRVVRENYTLSKKLDKTQKSAKWEQYQQLPEEEKRKLAADAATKKGVTNLPPKSQPKAVAPVKPAPVTPAATNLPPANPAAPVSNAK
jgi:hypothetical protein